MDNEHMEGHCKDYGVHVSSYLGKVSGTKETAQLFMSADKRLSKKQVIMLSLKTIIALMEFNGITPAMLKDAKNLWSIKVAGYSVKGKLVPPSVLEEQLEEEEYLASAAKLFVPDEKYLKKGAVPKTKAKVKAKDKAKVKEIQKKPAKIKPKKRGDKK